MIVSGLLALFLVGSQPPGPSRDDLDTVGDVTVTARPGRKPPRVDAVGYFRRHCFDPLRLTGYAAPPAHDLDWALLDDGNRARFGITDTDTPAYALSADARGATLLLKTERIARKRGIVEMRCTIVVIGGDQTKLVSGVSRLLGSPTQRHVGARDGSPKLDGWEQWLWTAIPPRNAKSWVGTNADARRPHSTWTVVADGGLFYAERRHVSIDLKTRRDTRERGLSMLTLSVVGAAAAMPAALIPPPAIPGR